MEQTNRFAELAMELMGSQAAAKFLREVWDTASPEVRQELADALVQRVRNDVERGAVTSFEVEQAIKKAAADRAVRVFAAEYGEVFDEKVRKQFERSLDRDVANRVNAIVADAISVALNGVVEELRQKARGY